MIPSGTCVILTSQYGDHLPGTKGRIVNAVVNPKTLELVYLVEIPTLGSIDIVYLQDGGLLSVNNIRTKHGLR
jgi:hypothetical protein